MLVIIIAVLFGYRSQFDFSCHRDIIPYSWRKGQDKDVAHFVRSIRTSARILPSSSKKSTKITQKGYFSRLPGGKDRIRTCGRFRLWFSRPVPSTTRPPFHLLLYHKTLVYGIIAPRTCSSTDRTLVSGTSNIGSIPVRCTNN